MKNNLKEILFISSYPPRECGIATYTQDLLEALQNKYINTFKFSVCALEAGRAKLKYPPEVKFVLDTEYTQGFIELANNINESKSIKLLFIQHEFGLFRKDAKQGLLNLMQKVNLPSIITFHTVLPNPNDQLRCEVNEIVNCSKGIVVMTKNAASILENEYGVLASKIEVISHGTHFVPHIDKNLLKEKYGLGGKKILSTFGLISSGKGIETTLESLPKIIEKNPSVMFLILGKTHPGVLETEGEKYRLQLEKLVEDLGIKNYVKFYNQFLPLHDLLEFLQLTDIYIFTSKDPNQAVSGTFAYAMSCGCPTISTPIPHALEVLTPDMGIIIDFNNIAQLTEGVNKLLSDEVLLMNCKKSILQKMIPTAWENSAIHHASLIKKIVFDTSPNYFSKPFKLNYRLPPVNLAHVKKLTTPVGIIQFSDVNQPNIGSGYTLDDTARAMIALCMHYELKQERSILKTIHTYLEFILFCQHPNGDFLNYVDSDKKFMQQNHETNISDSNGRAIWALGFLVSHYKIMPPEYISLAESILQKSLDTIEKMHSPRSIAFAIKGLHFQNQKETSLDRTKLINVLASRLLQMFKHESDESWQWFESYLTYANSVLPEAMLMAWEETKKLEFKVCAKSAFDFLLSHIFKNNSIKVISNKTWLHRGSVSANHGEQPIDVCYTILAMKKFHEVYKQESYALKLVDSFNWFLGQNQLNQTIYNPCTGGCFDGMEENQVNLNQGAESTLSYLISRLTIEKHISTNIKHVSFINNILANM